MDKLFQDSFACFQVINMRHLGPQKYYQRDIFSEYYMMCLWIKQSFNQALHSLLRHHQCRLQLNKRMVTQTDV